MRRIFTQAMQAVLVTALLALCACAREPRLVIIHCNDTHSHFEPVRSGEEKGLGGAIERAAFVDSIRAVYGEDKVLLLHAGDFSQGTSYFSELDGQLEPKVINDFGYDCLTLGNHEFDNGIEALAQRLSMLDEGIKVVCANIDVSQFELSKYVTPYTVIERGGMKIGIIGLESNLATNVSATISSRIPMFDNVEVTNKWADHLRNNESCDFVILLSHAGYGEDLEIAAQSRGLDVIIGGHTHTKVDDFKYVRDLDGREVPVVTDWCWGLEMGQINLY